MAFVIADGSKTKFRCWHRDIGISWTNYMSDATWYSRRRDADLASRNDEDAWFILDTDDYTGSGAPTKWAYKQACKALDHWREEARRLGMIAGVEPKEMSETDAT